MAGRSFPARAKRIVPSRPHDPEPSCGPSHRVCAGPPEAATFLSFPSEKNPMKRPSGDQKGESAPSVPSSTVAVKLSSCRTYSRGRPRAEPTKTNRRPSGEIARLVKISLEEKLTPGGSPTE